MGRTAADFKRIGYRPGDENRLDLVDDDFLERATPWATLLEKFFRFELHGIENVPAGPAIVVMPHSTISVDGFLVGLHIYRHHGRLVRGLTDHSIFTVPGLRNAFIRMGVVDGNRDNAVALLRRGEICLAMPGGAYEAWRPSRDRYRLFWEGRTGFVRVALAAQAAILPTVCIGADDALYLPFHALEWGQRILRRRFPLAPPLLPVPVKFTAYLGEPITFDEPVESADDEAVVARCHAEVVARVEEMIESGLRARRSLWY